VRCFELAFVFKSNLFVSVLLFINSVAALYSMQNTHWVLKGGDVYTEDGVIEGGVIELGDGIILGVGKEDEIVFRGWMFGEMNLPKGWKVIPGMIDVHIHGAAGMDVMDGDVDAIRELSRLLPAGRDDCFFSDDNDGQC